MLLGIVPKRTIVVRKGDDCGQKGLCSMTDVSWLTVQSSREHIECGIVVGYRLIGKNIWWLFVVLSWSMNTLNEHSRNGANHSQ